MSATDTWLIRAHTDGDTYARLTTLKDGHGFVIIGDLPHGLYPRGDAEYIHTLLGDAGIGYDTTPAASYSEALAKLPAAS